jgi:hypothetical protein
MNYNINTFQQAQADQKQFNEKTQEADQKHIEKQRDISSVFYDKERKIREEKYKAEREAEAEHEKKINLLKTQRAEADEKGAELRRIFNFMELLKKEDFNKDDFKVYVYDYPRKENGDVERVLKENCWCYPDKAQQHLKPIDTLHEDEHLKLNVYIGDTDKPKNKKCLFVVGKSSLSSGIHRSDVITLPSDYGIKTHTDGDDVRKHIKDLPTEKELLTYYEKNKTKLLKEFIAEHKKAVAELEEVRENTKSTAWKVFYLEHKKERFEKGYSRFEENEEYLKVCAELEKLKGGLN